MPVDANAAIEVTCYNMVPPMARGYVKDMRVRWALEEIGLPYRERFVGGAGGTKSDDHIADQPFGQVPVYKEGGLTLFESGAILIHIGEKDERLLPRDAIERARAIGWMIAALNSIEPVMQSLMVIGFAGDADWVSDARTAFRPWAVQRMGQLADVLGEREWLEDRFTIGDLVMIDVLRAVRGQRALIDAHPNLIAYIERGTTRPAFKAAMEAQLAVFEAHEAATA